MFASQQRMLSLRPIGTRVGSDLALEGGGAFELLLARPRLHGRLAQRKTLERDGEARVHEEAADRVHPEPAGSVPAAVHAVGDADRLRVLALQRELGRVLDDQDQAIGRGEAAVVVAVGINSGGRREVLGPASSADILLRGIGRSPMAGKALTAVIQEACIQGWTARRCPPARSVDELVKAPRRSSVAVPA